jgi:hypothetical protein
MQEIKTRHQAKASQGKPRQAKASQGKPRQAKASQGKPRQAKASQPRQSSHGKPALASQPIQSRQDISRQDTKSSTELSL